MPDLNDVLDAVAYHPYQYPKDAPEIETAPFADRRQGSFATQTGQIRAIVGAHGRALPLWVTENGWSASPDIPTEDADVARVFDIPDKAVVTFARELLGEADFARVLETVRGVSEADQARYLIRMTLLARAQGLDRVMLYTLDDFDVEPQLDQESAFGLFRVDGSEKPAAGAVRTMLARYGSFGFAADLGEALSLGDGERALAFTDGPRLVVAPWKWRGEPRTLRIGRLPGDAELRDMQGQTLAHASQGGAIDVPLSGDVVWLETSR